MDVSFSLGQIFALGIGYLFILFACAYSAERGWLPQQWIGHPATYVLSLGVYASAWAIYGSVGLAAQHGYGFLTYYLGIAAAFILAPVLLLPILRITRTYQLSSLADLFAFRFRSPWLGTGITLITLLATLPLLALQIQAVGDSIYLLTNESSPYNLAFAFCCVITLFAILFGARHTSLRERHQSLVVAIGFESLVKLAALLILGGYALYLLGGIAGIANLDADTLWMRPASATLPEGAGRTLLLLFFAAAVAMPHMFHMVFTENPSAQALSKAGWGLSLYLILLAIPVPLIYWAGQSLQLDGRPEYFLLNIGAHLSPFGAALAFVAGLAAASGTLIIITLSLAAMTLNHLVLPIYPPRAPLDIYRWLLWLRRLLIGMIILAGYLFYRVLSVRHDLASLGLTSFVGIVQFLPAIIAILYWPTVTRIGVVLALTSGVGIWVLGLWWPLLFGVNQLDFGPWSWDLNAELHWYQVALISLTVNTCTLIGISLITRADEDEINAAQACAVDALIRPKRLPLQARTAADFTRFLAVPLGHTIAEREVETALISLDFSPNENRPYALRRLRDCIQANLSGLMGPAIAQEIVDTYLPWQARYAHDDIHFMELRLEEYQSQLSGLARELDTLRRYHRQTLESLPLGICTLGPDGEVLFWNTALATLTQIPAAHMIGSQLADAPTPWGPKLTSFLQGEAAHVYKQALEFADQPPCYLALHKAPLVSATPEHCGTVLVIEEQTELKTLENELIHSERLASIGRLAAGVAHEIGNPITGISSLAQNLIYESQDEDFTEMAQQILQQTQRVSRIVHTLVSFAHAGQARGQAACSLIRVGDCVEEAVNLLQLSAEGRQREYICCGDLHAHVYAQAQKLEQILVNLLSNARDATAQEDEIHIQVHQAQAWVEISVLDHGCGIPADALAHIYEPFYTTKPAGQGTGLGLALVYSLVEEFGGHLHVDSPLTPAGGTCVRVRLPAQPLDG